MTQNTIKSLTENEWKYKRRMYKKMLPSWESTIDGSFHSDFSSDERGSFVEELVYIVLEHAIQNKYKFFSQFSSIERTVNGSRLDSLGIDLWLFTQGSMKGIPLQVKFGNHFVEKFIQQGIRENKIIPCISIDKGDSWQQIREKIRHQVIQAHGDSL